MRTPTTRTLPLLLVLALVALAALALTGCTTKVVTTRTPDRTITAAGNGRIQAAPDQAQMSFGSNAQAPTAKAALAAVSKEAAAVTAALKKVGIDAKDIQTRDVSVYPQYSNEKKPKIISYQASISVSVLIRDIEQVGDVIGAATDAGAENVNGPSFTLSDDSPARDDAITDAVADAKHRAETMAKAAGKKVGDVLTVSEKSVAASPVGYWPNYTHGTSAVMDGAAPIEPGQLDITAQVTVVYTLE